MGKNYKHQPKGGWREVYLQKYQRTGSERLALQSSGATARQVAEATSVGHPAFDLEFTLGVVACRMEVAIDAKEVALDIANDPTSGVQRLSAAKFLFTIEAKEIARLQASLAERERELKRAAEELEAAKSLREAEEAAEREAGASEKIPSIEDFRRSGGNMRVMATGD